MGYKTSKIVNFLIVLILIVAIFVIIYSVTNGDEDDTTNGDEDDTTNGDEDDTTNGDEDDTTNGDEDDTTNGDEDDTTNGDEGDTTNGEDVHLQFEIVDASGDTSFSFDEEKYVFRQYSEWSDFWRSFKGEDSPVPPLSPGEEMMIVVTDGWKPTSGWNIEVTDVVESEDRIEVFISEIPPDGPVKDVLTYPYQIVRTEYSEKEVIFTRNEI